jgi:site-specific recombinase XerD
LQRDDADIGSEALRLLMEIRPTIDRFLHHLEVERNFSAQSLRAYATDLRQF